MRVLVVRHHDVDSPGFVADAFARRGATVDIRLFPKDGPLPELEDYDHVVVLGSSHSVYERAPWIAEELGWLRNSPVPVFGICFGAQLLSTAFGGDVERSPEYEIGWVDVEPVGDLVSSGPWFQFHGDRCVLPRSATLLAKNGVGPQAFTIGEHFAVQFHPEVDAAQVGRWLQDGGRAIVLEAGKDPDAMLEETVREEDAATRRADELVDAYLAHTSR